MAKARRQQPLFMSVLDAVRGKKLTPADKLILTYLAYKQGRNGECWPGLRTIAPDLGISVPCVLQSIERLCASGLIEKTPGSQGRRHSHHYSVRLDKRSTEFTFSEDEKGKESLPLGGEKRSTPFIKKVNSVEQTHSRSIQKSTTSAQSNIVYDPTTRRFVGVSEDDKSDWLEAYHNVDVGAELVRAAVWWTKNPQKRKKDIGRFLTNWMSRAERDFAAQGQRLGRVQSESASPAPLVRDADGLTPRDRELARMGAR